VLLTRLGEELDILRNITRTLRGRRTRLSCRGPRVADR
jgi:hypothetical protein